MCKRSLHPFVPRGIEQTMHSYPGVAHGFQLSFPALDAAVKLDSDFKNGIRLLLMS